ncbi:pyridoxal phosphate-dependent transferase [Cristinia sonorae]|uniref:Pyridoxal phosphate-dependent transferase n=1 Tax=Cristinia sonorae TaxID=1940300 RepID=A0A8K0UYT7_9AGAR|nr:pyridoxal phosphate-dependent transferase [Cristinia sonorae]
MYNGIGLTTPRGSGTNGYVVRNLSTLRQHQSPADRAGAWDIAPPKHREPDAAILEHERKRKVEVKCLELQLELEDKGIDEDKIEEEVSALRAKLLASMSSAVDPKNLKPSDTHGIAAAKKEELSRMARALGTRKDYVEGDAFDREKQEQIKMKRMAEREERDRQRDEERARMQAQKEKWEAERKERDRLRRREEDRRRKEREAADSERRDRMPPPPVPRGRDRDDDRERNRRTRSPVDYRDRRSRSPVRRGPPPRRERDDDEPKRGPPSSRSPSPPPVRSRRAASLRRRFESRSPPPGYRRSGSVEPPSRRERGVTRSPSPHPPSRASREVERKRNFSPPRNRNRGTRSPSPPPRGERGPRRGRSASTGSSMSVSSGSSRSRSRSQDASSISPQVKQLLDRSDQYVLPVYARPPFVLSHGKGSYVWDTEGRKYLDFSAGIAVNALGHADDGVVEVSEAGKLLHTSNAYHHQWSGKLAELLVTLTQQEGGLGWEAGSASSGSSSHHGAKVFFSNTGTEANEGALKVARKVGKERWAQKTGNQWDDPSCDKHEIVCFENSFHGRSMGALSVTTNAKYQKPFEPLLPGVRAGRLNEINELDSLVTDKTCAVIVEPIQGEGGIHVANVDWLRALRKKCDETGAVLIFDEIQCGLYRSGTLWAHSALPIDCHPDIITMAKPLGNGYPIGAVLMRDSVAKPMTTGTHGTTFGGSPLACALGHHVLSRLSARPFVANVMETSAYLHGRLSQLPKWFPEILEPAVRGRGLILGLGFKDAAHPAAVVGMARERGVLVLSAGKNAVRLVPSLTIGTGEVDESVDVLESCLGVLGRAVSNR